MSFHFDFHYLSFPYTQKNVMKNLLLLSIFLFSIPLSQQAQNRAVRNFYHKYKKTEGTRNFVLPGFLIWFATGVANEIVDEPEAKVALKFAKKFKTMRLLAMEDVNHVTAEDYNKLISGVKKKNYEELISVKNLLILVSEEDTFTMMSMKTKIRTKDLNRLINDLMKLEKVRQKVKKEEEPEAPPTPPTKEKEKKKKDIKA